jgi:hypothetical protein
VERPQQLTGFGTALMVHLTVLHDVALDTSTMRTWSSVILRGSFDVMDAGGIVP